MKKKLLIIIPIVLIGILLSLYFVFKQNKPVPFVEKYNIKILPAKDTYSNPIFSYMADSNGNLVETEKAVFDNTKSTYNFYDLKVEKDGEFDIYTFKYDTVSPIRYTYYGGLSNLSYTYSSVAPTLFDYYTGEVYNSVTAASDTIGINVSSEMENMKYTDILWNSKKYTIGVLQESASNWEGSKLVSNENGKSVYEDKDKVTTKVTIRVPTNYDGLMIAIFKKGSTEDSYKKYIEFYNKYKQMKENSEKSSKKTDELEEMEKQLNRVTTLFESVYDSNIKYTKDDFDVIRVKDILEE